MVRILHCCVALVLGLAIVSKATAAAVDRCPALPPDSGLAWQVSEGPDFSVCYASSIERPKGGVIGVYLGFHPSFQPKEAQVLRSGAIEGKSVTWYRKQPDSKELTVGAETIHELKLHVAHIWVLAPGQQELVKLMKTAEQLRFSIKPQ